MATTLDLGKIKFTFEGDWDKDKDYEKLSIVKTNYNVLYFSMVDVPSGTEITDTNYWNILDGDFVRQYQGASDTAPTKRLDGSDLQIGDLYYDTDDKMVRFYKGNNEWFDVSGTSVAEVRDMDGDTLKAISADEDAEKGKRYLCDSSASSFIITLPSDPVENDKIFIWDIKGTFNDNPVTLARNGKTINGLAEDLDLDVSNRLYICEYIGNDDWRVY